MINNLPITSVTRWLVWEWLLDWDANDTSWSWNNWTATNILFVKTSKGYQSQAGSFNGSSSYAEISNTAISQLINWRTWFTINLIIKLNSLTNWQKLIDWRDTDYNWIYIETINSWQINVRRSDWVVNDQLCVTQTLSTWIWYSITITYDWTNWKIFVDWSEKTWWTSTKTLNSWTVISIWRWRANGDRFGCINWTLQSIRIYNTILTQDEISTLYREWLRQLWPSNIASYPQLMEWLVWYWDMRGDASNLVDGVKWTVSWATLTTDRFGNSNSAYSFDANNRYITTPNIPWTLFDWDFSISWYVNFSAFSSTDRIYMSWVRDFSIQTFSTWQIWIDFYNWTSYQAKSSILSTWIWYNFVWVRSKTSWLMFYINWSQTWNNSFIWNAWSITWTDSFWKDSRSTTWNPRFSLSGFMVFNRALSASELKLLYDLTSQDYIYPCKTYDLPNLREWLVLDLNAEWKDLSWNGNHLTLVNAPTVVRQWRSKGLSYNGSNQAGNVIMAIPDNITINIPVIPTNNPNTTYTKLFAIDDALFWPWPYLDFSYDHWNTSYLNSASMQNTTSDSTCIAKLPVSMIWWKFYMITVTFNSITNILKVYKDWIFLVQSTFIWTRINKDRISFASFYDTSNSQFMNWKQFNPRIRNRVLSDKEIQQLYYSQKANFIL